MIENESGVERTVAVLGGVVLAALGGMAIAGFGLAAWILGGFPGVPR